MQQNQPRGWRVYTIVLSLFGWVWVRVGVKLEVGGGWYHPYLHFNTGPILFMLLPSFLSHLKVSTTNDSDFINFPWTTMEVCVRMRLKTSAAQQVKLIQERRKLVWWPLSFINHKSHLSFTQNVIIHWFYFPTLDLVLYTKPHTSQKKKTRHLKWKKETDTFKT